MSLLTERAVACPFCHRTTLHRVARSLNAERSPERVQAILDDNFQRFQCPSCNAPYVVEDPFVFIDFARKLWIAHFPRSWEADWRTLEGRSEQSYHHGLGTGAPAVARSLGEGFTVRTVFGLFALRDKLLCFSAGIDDRLLEVLKLDLLRETPGLPFARSSRPTLLKVTADELLLCAALPEPGLHLHVGRQRLDTLAAQAPAWDAVLHELSAGPYVDVGRILPF